MKIIILLLSIFMYSCIYGNESYSLTSKQILDYLEKNNINLKKNWENKIDEFINNTDIFEIENNFNDSLPNSFEKFIENYNLYLNNINWPKFDQLSNIKNSLVIVDAIKKVFSRG